MIPITYEESKSSLGMPIVKASAHLNGGIKVVYGATREEAGQNLIDWLGNYYDLAPEAFVTLPSPDLIKAEGRLMKGVVNALGLMILVLAVVAGVVFIAYVLDSLTK